MGGKKGGLRGGQDEEVAEKLKGILEERLPMYQNADIRVSVDGSDGANTVMGAAASVVTYR